MAADMEHLRDMALFVSLVNAMSFSRAADSLGMPKSSLSRRIAGLEAAIGVRLLNRTTRRIELTEAGAIYYARCKEIVEAASVAHEQLKDMVETPRGHLRVSMVADDLGTIMLAPLVAAFARRHPGITFEIDLSPRRVDLLSEHFDVAIRVGEQPDSSMTARRLAMVQPALYAAPAYLGARGCPDHPSVLASHDCIRLPLGQAGGRWTLTRDGEALEIDVGGTFAVNNMGMAKRLAALGMGIGAVDDAMARDEVISGQLIPVLPDWGLAPIPVYAFTATRLLPAKTRAFIDFLANRGRAADAT
jgi:DNA-binding transcriptional LysR family regulator